MESSLTLIQNLINSIQRFADEQSLGSYLGLKKATQNISCGVASKLMCHGLCMDLQYRHQVFSDTLSRYYLLTTRQIM